MFFHFLLKAVLSFRALSLHPPPGDGCGAAASIDSAGAHTLSAPPFPTPASRRHQARVMDRATLEQNLRAFPVPPPPHKPTPFIHLYTQNAEEGGKSRKNSSCVPSRLLMSLSRSHLLSLFFLLLYI